MSLLMEALRKAEEAKRRMQQEEQQAAAHTELDGAGNDASTLMSSAASPFSLEEREADVTPAYIVENFTTNADLNAGVQSGAQSASDLSTAQDSDLPPSAPEREPNARNLARRQQRSAAASVFVAKQAPARNRKTLTVLVIVMVLMIPLGGGVLWYLQAASQPSIGVNPTIASYDLSTRGFVDDTPVSQTAAAPATQAPSEITPSIAAEIVDPAAEAVAARVDVPPPVADPATLTAPPLSTLGAEEPGRPQLTPADAALVAPTPAPAIAAASGGGSAATDSDLALAPTTSLPTVLEISRSGGARQINPELGTAYAKLQAGDLAAAGEQYQQVLASLPNSRDALLGLGLVRLREGKLPAARELYARALQLNPRDPLAQTGLLQTMQVVSPAEHESTLLNLIVQYPDVAPLPLALGNFYAAQQRWSEAQAAYYNALLIASRNSVGPVHPDYAFNLAVSLEQLDQGKAALGYYRQAEALAREVRPGFDPQLLISRLDFLQGQDQP